MLDELASRYLDGESSEAEERELLELLKRDPAARAEFARWVNQHAALRWQFSAPAPAVARRPRRRVQRNSHSFSLQAGVAAAAAAVFLIALAGLSRPAPSPPKIAAPPAIADAPPPEPPVTKQPGPFVEPPAPSPEPAFTPPPPSPAPAPPAPPPPLPPPPPPVVAETPRPTVAAPRPLATLETVENASVDGRPAAAGDPLLAEQVVEGAARLRWPDGTTIQLDGLLELKAPLALTKGQLTAEVVKQERPFVISTPHADARVLGTRFTLKVEAGSTRLEVREGKVRLSRGVSSVDVSAGYYALAAPGTPLTAKPIPLEVFRISFGPNDGSVPPDFAGDDGAPFDAKRGWGWDGDLRRNTRNRQKGSALERRHISGGSANHTDRWELVVPNGRYLLSVSCGDPFAAQGPHRVVAEGLTVIRDVQTKAGQHVVVERVPIEVKDGRFTLDVGALGSPRLDKDASADTSLNYVVLQRVR